MAGGAETPNIAALPAIARLGTCESARGPDADRHVKLLIQFAVEGSLSGAYSQSTAEGWRDIMIRNGLYAISSKVLDGVEGVVTGVSVLHNGTMRGGGAIFYHVGSYRCSGGKWKGQLTTQEHTLAPIKALFARKVVTIGFTGTYTDDGAEFEAAALVGKRSVRLKVTFRLLMAD
jgi:hypothetical protein